ncbi:MAG: diacylglycerol/lipid kinase family protein, partial [Propioniciclava sp.]
MSRLTLVVNPTAGHGRGRLLLPRIVGRLTAAGKAVDVGCADSWQDARDWCRRAAEGGGDGLIVAGGDGMAQLGYNACAATGMPLGLVPCGTGNDFARAVGIPRGWRSATETVLDGHTRRIDLMAVTGDLGERTEAFVGSVISTGFDELVRQRAERLPVDLGALTYGFAVLQELRQFTPLGYDLTIDGD